MLYGGGIIFRDELPYFISFLRTFGCTINLGSDELGIRSAAVFLSAPGKNLFWVCNSFLCLIFEEPDHKYHQLRPFYLLWGIVLVLVQPFDDTFFLDLLLIYTFTVLLDYVFNNGHSILLFIFFHITSIMVSWIFLLASGIAKFNRVISSSINNSGVFFTTRLIYFRLT